MVEKQVKQILSLWKRINIPTHVFLKTYAVHNQPILPNDLKVVCEFLYSHLTSEEQARLSVSTCIPGENELPVVESGFMKSSISWTVATKRSFTVTLRSKLPAQNNRRI